MKKICGILLIIPFLEFKFMGEPILSDFHRVRVQLVENV